MVVQERPLCVRRNLAKKPLTALAMFLRSIAKKGRALGLVTVCGTGATDAENAGILAITTSGTAGLTSTGLEPFVAARTTLIAELYK